MSNEVTNDDLVDWMIGRSGCYKEQNNNMFCFHNSAFHKYLRLPIKCVNANWTRGVGCLGALHAKQHTHIHQVARRTCTAQQLLNCLHESHWSSKPETTTRILILVSVFTYLAAAHHSPVDLHHERKRPRELDPEEGSRDSQTLGVYTTLEAAKHAAATTSSTTSCPAQPANLSITIQKLR